MSHNSHYSAYHTTKLQHSLSYNTLILIYSRAQEHYFPRPTITLTLSLLPKTHTYYLTSTNSLFVCLSGKKKKKTETKTSSIEPQHDSRCVHNHSPWIFFSLFWISQLPFHWTFLSHYFVSLFAVHWWNPNFMDLIFNINKLKNLFDIF